MDTQRRSAVSVGRLAKTIAEGTEATTPGARRLAPWLWLLLLLFFLRVLGQVGVALGLFGFLPPMEEWMSGAIPYTLLLPAQILILWLMAAVCVQFSRGKGWFVRPH